MEDNSVEIICLADHTPDYCGYTEIVKFGDRYFRTWDAESYASGLKEIDEGEYKRLLEYKRPEV